MIALGFGVMWWGYLQFLYGFTLLKGWDISWKELANPVHPYQWPAKGQQPPLIPKGSVLPTSGAATTAATGGTARAALA